MSTASLWTALHTPSPHYDELPAARVDAVTKLHAATAHVVSSDAFRVDLSDVDALLRAPKADALSGRRLTAVYLGLDPAYVQLPVCYRVEDGGGSETARSGFSTERSACNPTGHFIAEITLRSVTLQRAASTSVEARACAVNTLAHEWLHAVGASEATGQRMVFEDDDHEHQPGAVATYVVGAFAQCVYLADAYGSTKFDVRGCVEAVGTNTFLTASCEDHWGRKFLP